MNYKILFLVSIIIFVSLSVANVVVLSSGTIEIGTPRCEVYLALKDNVARIFGVMELNQVVRLVTTI